MVGMKWLNKLQFTNIEPGTISRSFFFVRKLVVDVINIEIYSITSGRMDFVRIGPLLIVSFNIA